MCPVSLLFSVYQIQKTEKNKIKNEDLEKQIVASRDQIRVDKP